LSKKQVYFADAERMYVIEQRSVDKIASVLDLNFKTVLGWKQEGNWEEKRFSFLRSKQMFHEELYEFSRKLMISIKDDIEKGEKIDAGRMYTFTRMLPLITKIKEYEDVASKKQESEEKKGLTPEILNLIEEEVLGIRREPPAPQGIRRNDNQV